jgi:hypothetical protein
VVHGECHQHELCLLCSAERDLIPSVTPLFFSSLLIADMQAQLLLTALSSSSVSPYWATLFFPLSLSLSLSLALSLSLSLSLSLAGLRCADEQPRSSPCSGDFHLFVQFVRWCIVCCCFSPLLSSLLNKP